MEVGVVAPVTAALLAEHGKSWPAFDRTLLIVITVLAIGGGAYITF
jgi:hypothetical protein